MSYYAGSHSAESTALEPRPEQLCERFIARIRRLKAPVMLQNGRPLVEFIERMLSRTAIRQKSHVWLHALRVMMKIEWLRNKRDIQTPTPKHPGVYFGIALILSNKYYEDYAYGLDSWVNVMIQDVPTISMRELFLWEHHVGQALGWNLTPLKNNKMESFELVVHNIYMNSESIAVEGVSHLPLAAQLVAAQLVAPRSRKYDLPNSILGHSGYYHTSSSSRALALHGCQAPGCQAPACHRAYPHYHAL